jgi:hypothetical protein
VARWRTSGALALLALTATACGQTVRSSDSTPKNDPAARPVLRPTGQRPVVVRGEGFRPHERVRLTAKTLRATTVEATADANGAFSATIRGVSGCDSVTVTATGSQGSRAQFNLSQVVCRN